MICVAAVKLSIESFVESLVSRYEAHFDKSRQFTEEHALEEMEISENAPKLVRAYKVLKSAMNYYWKKNMPSDRSISEVRRLRSPTIRPISPPTLNSDDALVRRA